MSFPKVSRMTYALFIVPLALVGLVWQAPHAAEAPTVIAPPAIDSPKAAGQLQTAVFAGGCFWGTQGVFEHVRGVRKVVSGYAGGEKSTAQYGTVSMGSTGHAESIEITYDPAQVSYGELLQVFFSVAHDPTQLNRQGPDSGTQYRSAVFYLDDAQRNVAQNYVAQLNKSQAFKSKIVTAISPLKGFYPAEGYHQDFLFYNPTHPYIVINDLPKIDHLKRLLPTFYVAEPATLNKAKSL